MIKKIFYKIVFIFIIFIFNNSYSFAEGDCTNKCLIKNKTPDALLKYLEYDDKIIINISNNLGKKIKTNDLPTKGNIKGNNQHISTGTAGKKISTKIGLRIYNSLFNWEEVKSGFVYFLSNIDGKVPKPITRDLNLINIENQKLNYLLSKVIKSGYNFNKIESKIVCEGIDDNGECEKKIGNDIETILKNLIKNNNKINLLIKKELGFKGFKVLVGENTYYELFAVPKNFKKDIKLYYNSHTYEFCAECKGGSIDRIKKSINKIILNDKDGKKGISEWKEAWDMLLGTNDYTIEKNNKIERALLTNELNKQGISSKNGDAVLNNLKNFQGNDFGFSLGNNPLTNSFLTFTEQISKPFVSKSFNEFTETISDIKNTIKDKNTFDYSQIYYTEKNLSNDEKIFNEVNGIVQMNQGIISKQNISSDKLQGRIINLHINLNQTINTLDGIIPKSEKICNQQDTGKGKCIYRK